jgi:uncharacterized integral membrane protein (TIGR00698 family)
MTETRPNKLPGLLLIGTIAAVATLVAQIPALTALKMSPLVVGILIGVILGNTVRAKVPHVCEEGITFSAKRILKLAIILYGFRITFAQIGDLGLNAVILDLLMVGTTLGLGSLVGVRLLGMDRPTAIMTAAGSAICGAAAIVATEPIVKAENHQTAAAVATVVVFGTLSMFLYPLAYRAGWIPMDAEVFGVYIGASIHGVAHVVAAGEAVGPETASTAVIVKVTRVLMLAPTLIIVGLLINRGAQNADGSRPKFDIPWFAFGFIALAGFNSLDLLPKAVVNGLVTLDKFLLTMAMSALGINTIASKFKGMGLGPLYLAVILFIWLIVGGFVLTQLLIT